jgi:cytoskeletal protein CcmA (bactofilin family)
MFQSKRARNQEIGSLIGAGTTVHGDVEFSGGLRIDGTVLGAVRCAQGEASGMLVVSEHGRVQGEVRAAHLIVGGQIEGAVTSLQLVELQPKARVRGDLRYRAIEMHHGSVVEGMMIFQPPEPTPAGDGS